MPFFAELKRRNVFKVGIAYAIVAWVLVQIVIAVKAPLHLPAWIDTLVIVLLAVGFPIALIITWAFELTPQGIRATGNAASEANKDPASSPTSNAIKTGQTAIRKNSIAVLPFANMSSDPEQEYFADGITEELLNSLAQIKDLQVTGRTSSFYYKGRNEDLRSIGETLGVEYILEGSVRKSADRLRITAQLINARSDHHLWSETYDRKLDDLFVIQEDIARSVAEALEITLGVGDLGRTPGMTHNIAAYEEFLLAGENKGLGMVLPPTAQGTRTVIHHLERAVTLDPEFGLAWTGLHYMYEYAPVMLAGGVEDSGRKIEQALTRARELTPDSPFLLSQISFNKVNGGEWMEADRYNQNALAAAKKYHMEDHFNYYAGMFQYTVGYIRQAIDYFEKGRVADPLNITNAAYLIESYSALGDHAAALAEANRMADVDGPQTLLIHSGGLLVAMAMRDRQEIEKWLDSLSRHEDEDSVGMKMRPLLDDPEKARAECRRLAVEMAGPFPLPGRPISAIRNSCWICSVRT